MQGSSAVGDYPSVTFVLKHATLTPIRAERGLVDSEFHPIPIPSPRDRA